MKKEKIEIKIRKILYEKMDSFLVEGDKPREIGRLNLDRHLFVDTTTAEILELLKSEKKKNRQKFIDALIWCSGSDDFQVGGKARKGWEKICLPLLKQEIKNEKKNETE